MSRSRPVSDRFDAALKIGDGDKSDAKHTFDHIDSPVSPLRAGGATATAATSSSSSSSGSLTGKPLPNAAAQPGELSRRNLSGELSGLSYGSPGRRPGHRRSGSGQLVFSGSVSSPAPAAANVLPAGNICPSGRIGKSGMMGRSAARSDVLGSGSANYGHGSVVRGGGGVGSEARSLRPAKVDPEEVTRIGNEHYKKGRFGDAVRFYDHAVEICPGNAACWSNRAAALIGLGRLGEAVRDCEEAIRLNPGYYKVHHRLGCLHLR